MSLSFIVAVGENGVIASMVICPGDCAIYSDSKRELWASQSSWAEKHTVWAPLRGSQIGC